jgi:hypothetical protein
VDHWLRPQPARMGPFITGADNLTPAGSLVNHRLIVRERFVSRNHDGEVSARCR